MGKNVKIVHETDGLPNAEDHPTCGRCNRRLVNPKWRRVGFGPACLSIARYERIMGESGRVVDVEASRRTKRAQARADRKVKPIATVLA